MENKVAIVIPAWNEAERLPDVLAELRTTGFDVIIVDDGSSDRTSEIASRLGAIVLQHIINRYQGAALRTGTKFAILKGYDVIVHFDADGQFRAKDIKKVIEPIIDGGGDIVFGSRFLDSSTKMPKFKEKVIMPIARLANFLLLGVRLTDPQSGFRAFRSDVYTKIDWQQDGWAHCSEIMHLAFKSKLRIKEVPITVIYHEFGQKLSAGFGILKDLFLARFIN